MQREREREREKGYTLKTAQRQAFLEIFNLHARDGKVGQSELKAMFDRVGYFISEDHFRDICAKTFEFKEQVSFEEFMEIFRVRESAHNLVDIKNAFRLLAGEQDELIPLELIYEIFRKQGVEKERIDDLMVVLADYVDPPARAFRYALFLSHLT